MQARIDKVALVGWRGISYLELELDKGPLTGLVGGSGAGKSTIAMCVCFALLPDHAVLDIRPISDVEDSHQVGMDALASRVDPLVGFGYVVLDLQSADGSRIVAGIHVRVVDGRAEFSRFNIESPPQDMPLQDFLRVVEGGEESYPDFMSLRTALAIRGITLRECRTVREYGEVLYNAGILPCDLSDRSDRALYARLIESAFRGGLSRDVAGKLKEYMLPAATRIPDSVDRLQKCADTVLRTQSALSESERQLKLLESTFGLGKTIVARAIHEVKSQIAGAESRSQQLRLEVGRHKATLDALDISDPQIVAAIESANGVKKSIESSFSASLKQCSDDQRKWNGEKITRSDTLKGHTDRLKQFESGRKAWRKAAGQYWEEHDEDALKLRIKAQRESIGSQKARLQLEQEEKTIRRDKLASGLSESNSALLGDALQAQTISEALDHVSTDEAISLEMALGGVVDGVVGVDISALSSLADNESFPHTFWVRTKLPAVEPLHKVGDWSAAALPGGFLVTSSRRQLTLGKHARDQEQSAIEDRLGEIKKELLVLIDALSQVDAQHETLLTNADTIAVYFAQRTNESQLHKAVETSQEALNEANGKFQAATDRLGEIDEERLKKTSAIEVQLRVLGEQQIKAGQTRNTANRTQLAVQEQLVQIATLLETAGTQLENIKSELGISFEWLHKEAEALPAMHHDVYISAQSAAITSLSQALSGEPADRISWISQIAAHDPVSCCSIWPPLREIVSDRISVENLDQDGADLIGTMAKRRGSLAVELEGNRSEMKAEAKSLYSVIATEIRKQESRIKKLSAFGEALQFGNVTGMRIRASQRTDLLEHLQNITQQIDMFVGQPDKPLEQQLSELFHKALNIKLDGSALLDYRTYVELSIEACRNGEWKSAAGLSGGESIGGGLAVALMLSKSLSQRGSDGRPRPYTPFFVIDEVQRLNGPGQAVIVEFGKQQGLQILVTAISLEATYECTMHVLNRIYTPEETIVSRQVRVVPELVDARH